MPVKLRYPLVFFFALPISALIAGCLYFLADYNTTGDELRKISNKTRAELAAAMVKEREIIRKGMAEKYRSEMTLYEQTAKSIQEERSKLRKLQSR